MNRYLELLDRCIRLAEGTRTHPNPRVGAVVVGSDGKIVSEGVHHGAGTEHAEQVALAHIGSAHADVTLVVSLEPCDHTGRTPPCTRAIIEAGVEKVVFGAYDPDPRVSGRGAEVLRQAGVEVVGPVDPDRVESLDPAYFHHRRTGRPRLRLKTAATLDGATAAADGSSQWITSEEARRDGHLLRASVDAVMIGAGTLRSDDPQLTVRIDGYVGRQPIPVVVAGLRPLPPDAKLWERPGVVIGPAGTVVHDDATLIEVPQADGRLDLAVGMRRLGELGVLDVLVEGGANLAASLWEERLLDGGVLYLAARMAGGVGRPIFDRVFSTLGDSTEVLIEVVAAVGPDVRIDWKLTGEN